MSIKGIDKTLNKKWLIDFSAYIIQEQPLFL